MRESTFRELPGTAGAGGCSIWSPDSHAVAFAVESSLKKVDLVGSRPTSICDRCVLPNSLRGGAWSRDDVLLLGGTPEDARLAGGLLKISANGGAMERVTTLETARGENNHRYPAFLPDGRRFTFAVRRDNGEHEIRVGDLGGAPPYTIASGFSKTAYADGYLLFGRDETLLALAFDASDRPGVRRSPEGERPGLAQRRHRAGRFRRQQRRHARVWRGGRDARLCLFRSVQAETGRRHDAWRR